MDTNAPQDKKYIFLDTCILQYLGDKNKSKSKVLQECLDGLVKEGYTLAISHINYLEHMHGLFGEKAQKSYNLLLSYAWFSTKIEVFAWASWLGGFYHDEKLDGIDVGDKIIAATAILEDGSILTANHKDYPHPFFVTEKSYALPYQVGHFTKTLDVVLYKPNFELLVRRFEEKSVEK
jgi:hypothetical protein